MNIKKDNSICPSCGNHEFSTSEELDRFDFGCGEDSVELSATIPVHTCESCGFQYTDFEGEDLRHNAICKHLGRLTPAQITELRKGQNLTRTQLAELSGIGTASLARWETGQLIQGAAHDSLLFLLFHASNIQRLAERDAYEPKNTASQRGSPKPMLESASFICISPEDLEIQARRANFRLH